MCNKQLQISYFNLKHGIRWDMSKEVSTVRQKESFSKMQTHRLIPDIVSQTSSIKPHFDLLLPFFFGKTDPTGIWFTKVHHLWMMNILIHPSMIRIQSLLPLVYGITGSPKGGKKDPGTLTIHPRKWTAGTQKWRFRRWFSFSIGWFLGGLGSSR